MELVHKPGTVVYSLVHEESGNIEIHVFYIFFPFLFENFDQLVYSSFLLHISNLLPIFHKASLFYINIEQ